MPFLDTMVMPQQIGTLATTIYRKPTHTDFFILDSGVMKRQNLYRVECGEKYICELGRTLETWSNNTVRAPPHL